MAKSSALGGSAFKSFLRHMRSRSRGERGPNRPQPSSQEFCRTLPDIWRSASYRGQSPMPEEKGDDPLVQMSYVILAGLSSTAKPAAQKASIITANPFAFQTRHLLRRWLACSRWTRIRFAGGLGIIPKHFVA